MNVSRQAAQILARQGRRMTVHTQSGEITEGLGLLQPFLSQSKDYLWQQSSKLGCFDGARFRLYGSVAADWAPEEASWVEIGGTAYSIQAIESLYWGSEPAYWWAIVTPRDQEEDCL